MIIEICVDESSLRLPLRTVVAGRASSSYFLLKGVNPCASAVRMTFSRVKLDGHQLDPFQAVGTRVRDGVWKVYAAPYCFPDEAEGLEYQVIAVDDRGNDCWHGTGRLNVRPCGANGSSVVPDVVPPDTYLRNPVTGLYHKLVGEVDEEGNITVAVEQEGIEK